VDFVDLHIWPVFNVADSAIVVGVLLIAVLSMRAPRDA
jgi:signal peptidase II